MYFPTEYLDKIRDNIRLSDLISKHVQLLNQNGKIKGLCPFHKEKTPSFTVNDEKGFYYCFGCGAKGDIFSFITQYQKLEFVDAVKFLAETIGLPIINEVHQDQKQQKNQDLFYVNKLASEWYCKLLFSSTGYDALNYLLNRGINIDFIKKYNIGFSAKDASLFEYLKQHQISDLLIEESGLVKNLGNKIVDKFQNRIMFPILNKNSNILGFGGRVVADGIPKYLNSPETKIFKKKEILFAENIAKEYAYKNQRIIAVEGYMDAYAMHLAGFHETVATLGTAVTAVQLKKMWHYCDEPIICLDGDLAGKKAMNRIVDIALPLLDGSKSLIFLILPDDNDPDDILKSGGKAYMDQLLGSAIPLYEALWNKELVQINPNTPEKFSKLELELQKKISTINDVLLKRNYNNFIKNKLWNLNRSLFSGVKVKKTSTLNLSAVNYKNYEIEHSLIAQVILYPQILENHDLFENFISINFGDIKFDYMRQHILDEYVKEVQEDNLSLRIKNELIKNGFSNEVDLLSGDKSLFVDKISNLDSSYIQKKWNIIFEKYKLSQLQKEYSKAIYNNSNDEKLEALNNEIILIRNTISTLESELYE